MRQWLRTTIEVVKFAFPMVRDGVREALRKRRHPPAPMARPRKAQDVVLGGLEDVRRRDRERRAN